MPVHLLDMNVLLAFGWKTHVHHAVVSNWMARFQDSWATCPLTQCGFVRISSNPKYAQTPLSVPQAFEFLREITNHPSHIFWPDSADVRKLAISTNILRGHKQITDAYLLSLAIQNAGRLVTLDQGIASLALTDGHRLALVTINPISATPT